MDTGFGYGTHVDFPSPQGLIFTHDRMPSPRKRRSRSCRRAMPRFALPAVAFLWLIRHECTFSPGGPVSHESGLREPPPFSLSPWVRVRVREALKGRNNGSPRNRLIHSIWVFLAMFEKLNKTQRYSNFIFPLLQIPPILFYIQNSLAIFLFFSPFRVRGGPSPRLADHHDRKRGVDSRFLLGFFHLPVEKR